MVVGGEWEASEVGRAGPWIIHEPALPVYFAANLGEIDVFSLQAFGAILHYKRYARTLIE